MGTGVLDTAQPVGVAVIGCGTISDQYLGNLTAVPLDLRVLGCADLDLERAKATQASQVRCARGAGSAAQAAGHPDVELAVVNLTIPAAHAEVTSQAVALGKSVWVEKPLALDTAAGRAVLAEAGPGRVYASSRRPDTVLEAPGLQTARRLISEGAIGGAADQLGADAGLRPGPLAP